MHLAEELNAQLIVDTLFVFDVPVIGDLTISESIFISWIIILAVLILCLIFTHNLKVHNPGKRQLAAEAAVTWIQNLIKDMLGEEAIEYTEYLMAVLIYIGLANTIGLFGMKPPTKDLNITIALAVMSIIVVQVAGIRKKRVGGWLKSFTQPVAIVTPLNIMELAIKPLSLCMRLFGNVIGAFVIMEIIKIVVPIGIPVVFSAYFDIFDGLLQAYVFVFLTSIYIKEAIE